MAISEADERLLYEKLERALTDYPAKMREAKLPQIIIEENDIPDEIEDFIISMASGGFDPGKYGLRSFQRNWIIKLGKKLIKNKENKENKEEAFIKATYIGTICIPDTDWDYGVKLKEQEYKNLNDDLEKTVGGVLTFTTKHPMFNPSEKKIISKGTLITITKKDLQSFSDLKEDIYRDARETIQLIEEANSFCHKIITILDEIKEKKNDTLHLKKVSYEILLRSIESLPREKKKDMSSVPKTSQLRYAFYLKNVAEEVKINITEKGPLSSLSDIVIKQLGAANIMAADELDALTTVMHQDVSIMFDNDIDTFTQSPQTNALRQASSTTFMPDKASGVSKKETKKRKRAKKRRSRRKL